MANLAEGGGGTTMELDNDIEVIVGIYAHGVTSDSYYEPPPDTILNLAAFIYDVCSYTDKEDRIKLDKSLSDSIASFRIQDIVTEFDNINTRNVEEFFNSQPDRASRLSTLGALQPNLLQTASKIKYAANPTRRAFNLVSNYESPRRDKLYVGFIPGKESESDITTTTSFENGIMKIKKQTIKIYKATYRGRIYKGLFLNNVNDKVKLSEIVELIKQSTRELFNAPHANVVITIFDTSCSMDDSNSRLLGLTTDDFHTATGADKKNAYGGKKHRKSKKKHQEKNRKTKKHKSKKHK